MHPMEREGTILKQETSRHELVVQPFLKEAFKEGAHRTRPKYNPREDWFRQIMIGVVYNDRGSLATLQELADRYGIWKQSAAESNKAFLRNLWNNSSPELQNRYPLNEVLSARKPIGQKSRDRLSAAMGGASLRIRAQIKNGVTSIDEICNNTNLSRETVIRRLRTLKSWGISVPKENSS